MNGKSVYTLVPPSPGIRSVQDEWGMFDPNQAGLKAEFRAARALNHPSDDDLPEAAEADEAAPAPMPSLVPTLFALCAGRNALAEFVPAPSIS